MSRTSDTGTQTKDAQETVPDADVVMSKSEEIEEEEMIESDPERMRMQCIWINVNNSIKWVFLCIHAWFILLFFNVQGVFLIVPH